MRNALPKAVVLAVLVAVALAALVSYGPIVASLIFTTTLVLVLSGIVAAIVCRNHSRAFWLGFAVFAGVYFAMLTVSNGPWGDRHVAPGRFSGTAPALFRYVVRFGVGL
jgi:hypothetical protein